MKIKEILITVLITLGVICLFCLNYIGNRFVLEADSLYKVYLDGKVLGYIEDKDKLYDLINKKQEETKKKYNVDTVYPPDNFNIIKTNSYNVELSTPEEIYNQISDLGSFTIQGYKVTIKYSDKDKKNTKINILNKQIFDDSIQTFIKTFIDEDTYNAYMNDEQEAIETTGKTIDLMYFDETITIKKSYINIDDKIYTDEADLTKYLLFGKDYKINNYTVQAGDTIESISEDNKLNPAEFLIANPKYSSVDSLLAIGDVVNITLINPVLTLAYDVTEVSDTEIPYDKKIEVDNSKSSDYSEVTTVGVTGVTRITENYVVKNGETQAGALITKQQVITEKVDQVTTTGPSLSWDSKITGSYVDTGDTWQWPTNYPYMITSNYGYRWGTLHDGVDISGTGFNSPVYAALDGVVLNAQYGGMCGSSGGNCIVIQHNNGYSTVYAHLATIGVSVGDTVTRGQVIGGMGCTGTCTGTHLHFGLFSGIPYKGGYSMNPLTLW